MSSTNLQDIKSTYRNLVQFYILITKQQEKIDELIPFTIAPKTTRYLGINLTKEAKNLYPKNYRVLMKEIEEDTKKWKNVLCSWIGRTNIVKMSVLPKQSTHLMQSLSKSHPFFSKKWMEQIMLKFLYGTRKDLK